MTIKVTIFNSSQLYCWITFCRNLHFFSSHAFKTNKMAEARGEILDSMLANLDLEEDIEVSSDLFIDEENDELVLQEDDIFCLEEESEEVKEIPTVVFVAEDDIQRVKEETQVSIFNRLGIEGSCLTAPDEYNSTVCDKVYKRQKNLEKHRVACEKEKG